MLLLQGRAEPEKEKTIQKGSKETQKGEQAQEGKTGHEGKTRQKGPEMQQGQQEAFLAKFRNWAGKPLGQNFAPQGEGKKKKKKKKKKSGRRPLFFFFFFFFFFPLVGTFIKKISALRAAAHEATTRPSRGGDFSARNPQSEPLGYLYAVGGRPVEPDCWKRIV